MTTEQRILIILFGFFFVVLGSGIGLFITRGSLQQADRAERLDPLSAPAIAQAAHGQEVLVQGVISSATPKLRHEFVAYREERLERDSDGDLVWRRVGTTTQPLTLEVEGVIQISNRDYQLQGSHVNYQSISWDRYGDRRYSGIVHGHTVTVIGSIVQDGAGNTINAQIVFAGTHEQYIGEQKLGLSVSFFIGLIFVTFGMLVMIYGIAVRSSAGVPHVRQ
ncbi:hypothetical protein [Candidatus Viridilinea mediisalina]|uniref:Uncharacterized protein n=1 Tax=Candidatus Viridilinea mediisalina TaxID=2024553 RepID=A0A2A6RK14_9CHLR|nr:hypothetical protein [Candidatus Viridilinea mediisalina]PDW03245.1 hypothetical protein CJ255_09675 [Candidatus Viridilinea mediisalina]